MHAAGSQSEQTRMLCQRVLTCSVVKQKALGWKHSVETAGIETAIQESKKVAQGRQGCVRIAAMNSASMRHHD